jgi:UDP-N-acetylmuramoylalanine--D-glutamate ligase
VNIAIVGFGLEGKSAYSYFKDGNSITVCDLADIDFPDGIKTQTGSDYLKDLERFDMIVRSPSIKPEDIAKANRDQSILSKVTSCTNEFFKVSPTKNIIGVTGTKGKGTTSTLVAKMLESSGKHVHIGGNIGVPAIDLLKQNIESDDWVVLELSSFQLIDIKYSPHIAICLMVVPEHLNWHSNIEEYYEAKSQLFRYQDAEDVSIFYAQNSNSKQIASNGNGKKLPYYENPGAIIDNQFVSIDGQDICHVSELKLIGKHNWQNICAAVTAVWQVDQNI